MTQAVRSMPEQEGASPRAGRQYIWWTPIASFALVLSALLALPNQTITSKYVNDLFVFLDGAHRIWSGQVPNVDFHTSLGALTFYIPAAGYGLSGRMGGAMPVGMAIVILCSRPLPRRSSAAACTRRSACPWQLFCFCSSRLLPSPAVGD
ncbi:hypothetical protein [Rhizobium leguminosarum]|uniref:hypothetical protein n=1 Tax=Rhizobium leguminosarum TaxID=384 RepID=UPI0021BBC789|nr:hypothetical protein [Rhizobium leguminosarum]